MYFFIIKCSVLILENSAKLAQPYKSYHHSFFHLIFSGYDQYWDVQYRNGQWNNGFIFQVGVEISDHPLTAHLSSFPVNVALQVGNLIMQGTYL
jgi:hypothetical protein